MSARVILTYDDYAARPEDGHRYELYEGELVMTPSPRTRHQSVIGNLHLALAEHVRSQALGELYVSPLDVILSRITVLQPDLVYVERARLGIVTERAIEGAPTLVVEVLSSSTSARDRGIKQALYASPANTLEQQLALEATLQREAGHSADFQEGVKAFLEKRTANFTGR